MNNSLSSSRRLLLIICLWLTGCAPASPTFQSPGTSDPTSATSTPSEPTGVTEVALSESATPTAPALEATATPVPDAPSSTPELTATPTITPTRIYVPLDQLVSADPAVTWGVPQGWWELTEQVAAPEQTLHWRVWANRDTGAAVFSPSPPDFPEGLMLLTLHVEPEGISPFPPPDSASQFANWIPQQEVYAYERSGPEVEPFTLRLGLAVVRSPQRFNLMLDCLIPQGDEAAHQEALCRDIWEQVAFSFGLCARPSTPSLESEPWRSVSDAVYGYSFEVPASWMVDPGVTGDRLTLFSDPEVVNTYHSCPRPDGLMKMDFAAGSAQDFSARQEGGGPELEGFTETIVGSYPVWIRKSRGGDADAPDLPPGFMHIAAYVQGPSYWYLLAAYCTPPTGADAAGQKAYHAQCETMFWQILERFQIKE